MKKLLSIYLVFWVVTGWLSSGYAAETNPITLATASDKTTYVVGDEINIKCTLSNIGKEDVYVYFRESPLPYDSIKITDPEGRTCKTEPLIIYKLRGPIKEDYRLIHPGSSFEYTFTGTVKYERIPKNFGHEGLFIDFKDLAVLLSYGFTKYEICVEFKGWDGYETSEQGEKISYSKKLNLENTYTQTATSNKVPITINIILKPNDAQRWDLQMIEEAPIWRYLLVNADLLKYWPERKIALQTIVNKFPDSQWADDAALILAWGKVSFEKDSAGAIEALRKVIEKYPEGQTVLGLCYISGDDSGNSACMFDSNWRERSGGLAYLNPDRTIRMVFPFDRNGTIPRYLREVLVYFDHLEKYPKLTADKAQDCIAQILWKQGNISGAIIELEAIIARHPDLAVVNAADREAAAKPDGYLVGNESVGGGPIWRPEYDAYLWLMAAYQGQGQHDRAVATGLKLADICSPDGRYWGMNRRIGDEFAKSNHWVEAERQYRVALKGCRKAVDDIIARQKMFDNATDSDRAGLYASKTPDFVSWEHTILKVYGWQTRIEELEKLVQEAQAKKDNSL